MNGSTVLPRFIVAASRTHSTAIRRTMVGAVLPALAGALLLAGCGSASGTSAGASASSSASATSTAVTAFETCLKQHGVKVTPGQFARPTGSFTPRARPTGSFTPRAFPSGSFTPRPGASFGGANAAAFTACAKYAPAGFRGGFGGGTPRVISSSALAAFKSCLTSNGVKVTGSTAPQILSELRNSSGKTAAALKTCEVLIQPAPATPAPTVSS